NAGTDEPTAIASASARPAAIERVERNIGASLRRGRIIARTARSPVAFCAPLPYHACIDTRRRPRSDTPGCWFAPLAMPTTDRRRSRPWMAWLMGAAACVAALTSADALFARQDTARIVLIAGRPS